MYVRTVPRIVDRQMGHLLRGGAQVAQHTRWPHGTKTTHTSSSMHILQVRCSFNWRFSSISDLGARMRIYIYQSINWNYSKVNWIKAIQLWFLVKNNKIYVGLIKDRMNRHERHEHYSGKKHFKKSLLQRLLFSCGSNK